MEEGIVIKTEECSEDEKSIEDMDAFIQLVKDRPELYDSSLKDHHNQELIRKLWQDISRELDVPASACKIKWHSLRTSYNRYIRQLNKLTKKSKMKKKWHLADKMSFIKPFISPYKRITKKEEVVKPLEIPDPVVQPLDEVNASDSDDDHRAVDDSLTDCSNPRKRNSAAEMMVSFLKSESDKKRRFDDDPMVSFFKGLLPDINRLSDRRKRNFRSDILQTLNFYLDEQEDESTTTSTFCGDRSLVQSVFGEIDYNDQRLTRILPD